MKVSKIRIITFLILMLIISVCMIPFALAKPRKTYLTDFLMDNHLEDDGFSNCKRDEYRDDDDIVSYEATAYALDMLGNYHLLEEKNIWGEVEKTHNSSDLKDNLEEAIDFMFIQNIVDIYKLYYILEALDEMDEDSEDTDLELGGALIGKILAYISSTAQVGGGFAPTNTADSAALISTYIINQIYHLIGQPDPNQGLHKYFVLDCLNSDGGYGGDPDSASTIINTYYAVLIMDFLEAALISLDQTVKYFNSFYIDDENDEENFGGYLPDSNADNALLSSTYYCVKSLLIIEDDIDEEDDIVAWVLNQQNHQDGGFIDGSDGYKQTYSSVVSTYFAYKILDEFGKLELLEEKVFMKEFEWYDWLIFWIIFCSLCLFAIVVIIIYRKRRI